MDYKKEYLKYLNETIKKDVEIYKLKQEIKTLNLLLEEMYQDLLRKYEILAKGGEKVGS